MKGREKTKFDLDRFEIAKLKNPKEVRGGDGTDDPDTVTNTLNVLNSGVKCKDIKTPPPPSPTNGN